MSSEAATYFSDALATAPEVCGTAQAAAATPSNLLYDVQPEASVSNVIPIAEVSDETLLEQVRQGTREGLGVLFRRHARTVRNVAYRILRNEAEADDLVQDVFIFIFRKASTPTSETWPYAF